MLGQFTRVREVPEIQSKTAMVLEKFHGNGKYSRLAAHLSMMDHQVFYRWKNSTILGGCQQPGKNIFPCDPVLS